MISTRLTKEGAIELSDKKSALVLKADQITLGEQGFNEPGEYETNGIEIIRGTNGALIVWERLQIVYVFSLEKPTVFEESQFSSCDVLCFYANGTELNKNNAMPVLDSYDPKVLILPAGTHAEASFKTSLKLIETNNLKLSEQTMPVEGRDGYLLS